jgi:hypothetical protein
MLLAGAGAGFAHAADRVTLTNGFEMLCDHEQLVGDRVRLFMSAGSAGFVEFAASEIANVEPGPPSEQAVVPAVKPVEEPTLTEAELHEMLTKAGAQHNLDVDLLASVMHAESGGNVRAVSRAGAQGLMQLMPKTAKELGVRNSFRAEENINGGTAYLDSLLVKYHDKLALALAAYNAGPSAVDHWHGIPPYRETRLYVARVIREFNRAALARRHDQAAAKTGAASVPASGKSAKAGTQVAMVAGVGSSGGR